MTIKNRKGIVFPLAIFLMLLAVTTIFSIKSFILEKIHADNNEYISSLAQQEAENALVYGIYALGTKQENGGHKCQNDWYVSSDEGIETTNEDGGLKNSPEGYVFKRYITLKGTKDYHDAILTGIGQVYLDKKLIKESKVEMKMNLLYNNTAQGAENLCSADSIQMKKETWRRTK